MAGAEQEREKQTTIGILAHCFGKLPLSELVDKTAGCGFSYVQLALSKAIADLDCGPGKLSPGLADHIGEAFNRKGVKIPVLGCYVNLIDPDPAQWRANVERFKEHLRFARHFGASIVATETGVPKRESARSEDRRRLHDAIGELVEEAEKWGIFIGLEPANRHLIDSSAKMAEVIERFPSRHLGVVLDPCNILTGENFAGQDEVIREAFALLGDRIVSLHAKDIEPSPEGGLEIVAAGTGRLNYPLFLQLARQYKPKAYMTLERISEDQMSRAVQLIRKLAI